MQRTCIMYRSHVCWVTGEVITRTISYSSEYQHRLSSFRETSLNFGWDISAIQLLITSVAYHIRWKHDCTSANINKWRWRFTRDVGYGGCYISFPKVSCWRWLSGKTSTSLPPEMITDRGLLPDDETGKNWSLRMHPTVGRMWEIVCEQTTVIHNRQTTTLLLIASLRTYSIRKT